LVVHPPEGESFVRQIDKDPFLIGRGKENHLVLDDPTQARHHVEIKSNAGSYVLHDPGCRCAKRVNGVVVRDTTELRHGDIIALGTYWLTFLITSRLEVGANSTRRSTSLGAAPEFAADSYPSKRTTETR
jgi:pSer/pThr/pTyr-binding forkhead associated (FHA) protein